MKESNIVNKNVKTLSTFAKSKNVLNFDITGKHKSKLSKNEVEDDSKSVKSKISNGKTASRIIIDTQANQSYAHDHKNKKAAVHILKSSMMSGKSGVGAALNLNLNPSDSFDVGSGRGSLKEMIENSNVEQKMFNLIDDTLELFNQKTSNKKEEKERFELIEKTEYEKMKTDNEVFRSTNKKLKEEIKIINKTYEKADAELNALSRIYNDVETQKTNDITKIYSDERALKDILLYNSKLSDMIGKERVQKDNIFRALIEFIKKYNKKIPNEMKEIYNKFNNEHFSKAARIDSDEKIIKLKDKMKELENELKLKDEALIKIKDIVKVNLEKKTE
jgi:hypothetical protein